jgi:membrane protease YdiL (CAAX protease family)
MGVLIVATTLFWAFRVAHLTRAELGLSGPELMRSAGIGLLVALIAGFAALLFLRFPPLVTGPVVYTPLADMTPGSLFWRVGVWMPLDTVLPEELAFRGLLLAELRRYTSPARASLLCAGVFTAWHLLVVSRTLALTNLGGEPFLLILGLVGAFVAIFAGGLLFAALRIRTRHLAAAVVAHWGFNTLLLIGLTAT